MQMAWCSLVHAVGVHLLMIQLAADKWHLMQGFSHTNQITQTTIICNLKSYVLNPLSITNTIIATWAV